MIDRLDGGIAPVADIHSAISQMPDFSRYARQTILPQIGSGGQARLAGSRVLVVGAGGLAVPVLQYLAGAGIGCIVLVDADRVERHNLHRQPLYGEADIGRPKAEAARAALARLNAQVTVEAIVARLDPSNAGQLVGQVDLALDCTDSYAAGYVLSDHCQLAGKPLVTASALALSGYIAGVCGGAPSLRALFPELPQSGATCATAGVMGPVVALLGCLQAQMALSVLLGLEPSPLGQFIGFDGSSLRFSSFRFDTAPEPEGRQYRFIARCDIKPDDFLIELRGEDEAPVAVAPHARRLRVEDFGAEGPLPSAGQRAVFTCRSGLRAWRAADRIRDLWNGEICLIANADDRAS